MHAVANARLAFSVLTATKNMCMWLILGDYSYIYIYITPYYALFQHADLYRGGLAQSTMIHDICYSRYNWD